MDEVDRGQESLLVVGLGASAGGIQALRTFFDRVPPDSGAAYVVVLHLSPDHDSQLANVLQSSASIPITKVSKAVRLEPNHVYVAPPDKHLMMADGELTVSPNTRVEDRRAPVDIFFRTLADTHGTRAIGVILSGTGANGSMGLKRLKEHGGTVLVQNPREAEFSEMPRNAIATGFVDEVLPVAEIPARILAYRDRSGPAELGTEPDEHSARTKALREIFTLLRVRTGHDFSDYKRPTLLRRIGRRIGVRRLPDLPRYAAYLRDDPDEARFLLKDLLISVTNFFRDRPAFETLESDVLPDIFKGKGEGDVVRVWVVGCATGEEAYSVAMLLAERTLDVIDAPKVQVFATDIDEAAVATAREGFYTLNDAADVAPERLRRFFTKEGDGYRVRREIREMILFARHNVMRDPPFSRLDLATCRNLLIYLNQSGQERVMETLHFALVPGGYLMLGSSESVDGAGVLYESLNREQHIYRSRLVAARQYPLPDGAANFPFPQIEAPRKTEGSRAKERITYGDLHGRLLEAYAPPSVVVNEAFELVHISERAGRYLRLPGGEPSENLLQLVRPELRLELRTALHQAVTQRTNIKARPVRLDDEETITLHVRPVLGGADSARGFLLIVFVNDDGEAAPELAVVTDEPIATQLEAELSRLKAELRLSSSQHELNAEELRASNEELQALNEELRSAAEELETSKEELQSINEELSTVNQELKVQIEETTIVSNNLHNLINSTDFGVIFLDRRLRVQLYSPASREVFNLIPADVGRPLADITNRFDYADVLHDSEAVLETLQGLEREVKTHDQHVYMMRVLPYRTSDDRINGVVITFVDITERKSAETARRASERKYRLLFDSIDEGFCIIEMIFDEGGAPVDYRFIETNQVFEQQTGLLDAVGKTALELVPDLEPKWTETYGRVAITGESARFEEAAPSMNRHFDVYASAVGEKGLVALVFRDILERKRRDANQDLLVEIADDLNRLTTPAEIIAAVGARLGAHLNLSSPLIY